MRIQSATTATKQATLLVTARASAAPDPDPEAAVTIAIVEATEEETTLDQDLTLVFAVEIPAEIIVDTPDPDLAIATMEETERMPAVEAPTAPEVEAATETTAEETLLLRREVPQATEEAQSSMLETPKSE